MIRQFIPIIFLTISNVFMTFAWYGHLKFKNTALWIVILVSWLIAFLEYCFQVPANRIGHEFFSAAQLKTMQDEKFNGIVKLQKRYGNCGKIHISFLRFSYQ